MILYYYRKMPQIKLGIVGCVRTEFVTHHDQRFDVLQRRQEAEGCLAGGKKYELKLSFLSLKPSFKEELYRDA